LIVSIKNKVNYNNPSAIMIEIGASVMQLTTKLKELRQNNISYNGFSDLKMGVRKLLVKCPGQI
jgi:hypothetical protein